MRGGSQPEQGEKRGEFHVSKSMFTALQKNVRTVLQRNQQLAEEMDSLGLELTEYKDEATRSIDEKQSEIRSLQDQITSLSNWYAAGVQAGEIPNSSYVPFNFSSPSNSSFPKTITTTILPNLTTTTTTTTTTSYEPNSTTEPYHNHTSHFSFPFDLSHPFAITSILGAIILLLIVIGSVATLSFCCVKRSRLRKAALEKKRVLLNLLHNPSSKQRLPEEEKEEGREMTASRLNQLDPERQPVTKNKHKKTPFGGAPGTSGTSMEMKNLTRISLDSSSSDDTTVTQQTTQFSKNPFRDPCSDNLPSLPTASMTPTGQLVQCINSLEKVASAFDTAKRVITDINLLAHNHGQKDLSSEFQSFEKAHLALLDQSINIVKTVKDVQMSHLANKINTLSRRPEKDMHYAEYENLARTSMQSTFAGLLTTEAKS